MQKGAGKSNRSFASLGYVAVAVFVLGTFVAILNYYNADGVYLSPAESEVQSVEYPQLEGIIETTYYGEGLGVAVLKFGTIKDGNFIASGLQTYDTTMPAQYEAMNVMLRDTYASGQAFQITLNFNTPFQSAYQVGAIGADTGAETTPESKECWVECSCQVCTYAQYTCNNGGSGGIRIPSQPLWIDSCKSCLPKEPKTKKFYYDCKPSNEPQCATDSAVAAWCGEVTGGLQPATPESGDGSQCKKDSEAECSQMGGTLSGPKTHVRQVPEATSSGRG